LRFTNSKLSPSAPASFSSRRASARDFSMSGQKPAMHNSRLVAFDGKHVTFQWKDYRAKLDARYKLITLDVAEFIRRFLIHVLPDGFHRIRH
jgi:hypothetical protein